MTVAFRDRIVGILSDQRKDLVMREDGRSSEDVPHVNYLPPSQTVPGESTNKEPEYIEKQD